MKTTKSKLDARIAVKPSGLPSETSLKETFSSMKLGSGTHHSADDGKTQIFDAILSQGNNDSASEPLQELEIVLKSTTYLGQAAFLMMISDISESKQLFQLKSNESYRNHVIASVSHELKTPINCILGLIGEAETDEKIAESTKKKLLRPALSSVRLLLFVLQDIMDVAEMNMNSLVLTLSRFKILPKLQEILGLFRAQADMKSLNLTLNVKNRVSPVAYTDQKRLSQILVALLSNALKFTNAGTVTLTLTPIDHSVILFEVADTGAGMTGEEVAALLKVLDKPTASHTVDSIRDSKGICFGLTTAQRLVKCLGSSGLSITSEKNQGSTFSFTLPCGVPQSSRKLTRGLDEVALPASPLRKGTVGSVELKVECHCRRALIVDDNEFNVMTLKTKLTKRGYTVLEAYNGLLALNLINKLATDEHEGCESPNCPILTIIFMDVDMPVLNGIECTKEIQKMIKNGELFDIPIVGCSAFDKEEDIALGKTAGMKNYIAKPVLDTVLDQVLTELVPNKR
jgi:signal transduction histidine kinase